MAIDRTTRFNSAEQLSTTLVRYALLYNQHIPQKVLDHRTPIEAMQEWQRTYPELFVKRIRKLTGPDKKTSEAFRNPLKEYGITASMSCRGNCWGNVCSETLFDSLQVERLHGQHFVTRHYAEV